MYCEVLPCVIDCASVPLQCPDDSFATLLNRFSDEANLEGTFFFCRQDGIMQIAKLLETVDNLSLEDRWVLILGSSGQMTLTLRVPTHVLCYLHTGLQPCRAQSSPADGYLLQR